MPFDPPGAPVAVARVDDTRWALLAALTYRGARDVWTVPAGYVTDFATVPVDMLWLIPRTGRYTAAAVVHDWLLTHEVPAGRVSAVDADGVFRRIMSEQGVPPVRAWLMWCGVRWGAAVNPARRRGWWSTAPAVLALSGAALPFLLPAVVGIRLGLLVYTLAERVVGWVRGWRGV